MKSILFHLSSLLKHAYDKMLCWFAQELYYRCFRELLESWNEIPRYCFIEFNITFILSNKNWRLDDYIGGKICRFLKPQFVIFVCSNLSWFKPLISSIFFVNFNCCITVLLSHVFLSFIITRFSYTSLPNETEKKKKCLAGRILPVNFASSILLCSTVSDTGHEIDFHMCNLQNIGTHSKYKTEGHNFMYYNIMNYMIRNYHHHY